jgi:putative spermidine/putrescine transport system substrate-binding protein
MTRRSITKIGVVALTALTLVLAGCGANDPASTTTSSKAPERSAAAPVNTDSATATSLADFGTLADLETAAKAEGQLNVIALPHDWANWGEVIAAFKAKYPEITVNEQNPTASSAEEIQAAQTNKGLDNAPDVFDLGLAVALANTDMFAPYKVATWDDIPADFKDADGKYYADYGGYMSVGYDSSYVDEPASFDDLLDSKYSGLVAINGDPTQAGSAFATIGLATLQNGGTLDDFQPGIDFFSELNAAGNFLKVDPTTATVVSGETPMVFDWDYLNAAHTSELPTWKVHIFDGAGYASYYNQAINADAPNPAAARLWMEFLYSDEAQNLWLKSGARPIRMEAMIDAGTIDEALAAALPEAPDEVFTPTQAQEQAAGALLGEKWAAAIA